MASARSPLSPVSANAPAPLDFGTPAKKSSPSARTFSPDGQRRLPPTPSPAKPSPSPSPAKQPSDMASELAKSKLFQRMQQTCKTPQTELAPTSSMCREYAARNDEPGAASTPGAAGTPAAGTPAAGTPAKTPGSGTPGWDGTPARRLREEASILRSMSRLNSPALQSAKRGQECRNTVGDELARTRSQLAVAEAKVRKLETPDGRGGGGELLTFEGSTPNGQQRIGAAIPRQSPARCVVVTVRDVREPTAAHEVSLQTSASRPGSVVSQLKKNVAAFEGAKTLVHATARGWERVSKAEELQPGEQCWVLFENSEQEKEQLPQVMLDQARLAEAVHGEAPPPSPAGERSRSARQSPVKLSMSDAMATLLTAGPSPTSLSATATLNQ